MKKLQTLTLLLCCIAMSMQASLQEKLQEVICSNDKALQANLKWLQEARQQYSFDLMLPETREKDLCVMIKLQKRGYSIQRELKMLSIDQEDDILRAALAFGECNKLMYALRDKIAKERILTSVAQKLDISREEAAIVAFSTFKSMDAMMKVAGKK